MSGEGRKQGYPVPVSFTMYKRGMGGGRYIYMCTR